MPVVGHSKHAADLGGQNQIHSLRARVPGVGHQFGQCHLRNVRHLPKLTHQVVVLEQRGL